LKNQIDQRPALPAYAQDRDAGQPTYAVQPFFTAICASAQWHDAAMRDMILVKRGVIPVIRHYREVVMWHVIGVAVCGLFLLTGQVRAADVPADAQAASLGEAICSRAGPISS
jgi:hypothetical protein